VKWQIELRPQAIADLDDAAAWYEERRAGLGRDLVRAVILAISTLALTPLTSRLRHRVAGIRWAFPRRFPYRIVYQVEGDKVVVLAVVHAARSDSEWRKDR